MQIAVISVLVVCLCAGCGLIMIGDPVEKQDLTSEDEAEENLKAVRAILTDRAGRPDRGAENVPAPPSATDPASSLADPVVQRPVPSKSSSVGPADLPAKLPWAPTPPERPAVPDRPVPAYTSPAPVGPDHSGSIRCAPDGMGGQRCVGR